MPLNSHHNTHAHTHTHTHTPFTHALLAQRRYADVLVHRVLMAALGLRPLPESLRDRELMHGVVDNLNTRHR